MEVTVGDAWIVRGDIFSWEKQGQADMLSLRPKRPTTRKDGPKLSRRQKKGREAGITLAELLVSLLIFSISMAALFSSFTLGLRWARLLGLRTSAVALAKDKIEETLNIPYAIIALGTSVDNPVLDYGKVAGAGDDVSSTRRIDVVYVVDHKEVTVNVAWVFGGVTYDEEIRSAVYP